jgi:hypothetical protein
MKSLPTWLRAALITGAQALAASLLLILLNLVVDIQSWVSDRSNPVDLSGSAQAVAAAVMTFATFLVTAVYRSVKPVENSYPELPKPE